MDDQYEKRVKQLESEGLTTSDAQGVAAAEFAAEEVFEEWLSQNEDEVSTRWEEHLNYMQDSIEHMATAPDKPTVISMLRRSDKSYREFAYEMYEQAMQRLGDQLEVAREQA